MCKFYRPGEQQQKNATKKGPTDWAATAVGGCRCSGVGREKFRVNPSSFQAFPLQGGGPQAGASFFLVGFSLLVVPSWSRVPRLRRLPLQWMEVDTQSLSQEADFCRGGAAVTPLAVEMKGGLDTWLPDGLFERG